MYTIVINLIGLVYLPTWIFFNVQQKFVQEITSRTIAATGYRQSDGSLLGSKNTWTQTLNGCHTTESRAAGKTRSLESAGDCMSTNMSAVGGRWPRTMETDLQKNKTRLRSDSNSIHSTSNDNVLFKDKINIFDANL